MKPLLIEWTEFSVSCLDEIYLFILDDSQSERIASKLIQQLISGVEHLAHAPLSGTIEPLLKRNTYESRYIIVGNYKIIYRVKESTIFITDVFHTKQNPIKIVKRNRK